MDILVGKQDDGICPGRVGGFEKNEDVKEILGAFEEQKDGKIEERDF